MSEKDIKDFNSSYEKKIQSIKLPERLRQDYRITDCLKESEIKNSTCWNPQKNRIMFLRCFKSNIPLYWKMNIMSCSSFLR